MDMCKLESSQEDESRAQSVDSSKAYRNTSAFKCSTVFVNVKIMNDVAVLPKD